MKSIYFLFLALLLIACKGISDNELNDVLAEAKENKKELLKVIEHYQNDSLKLKAAIFLIKNMTGKGSVHYAEREKIHQIKKQAITQGFLDETALKQAEGSIQNFSFQKDIEYITANYLIKNIDIAFEVWNKRPWAKKYSFDEFCEYVLPYRISREPIEDWREKYYKRYTFLLDSIYKGDDVVEAVNVVCKYLKQEGLLYTHIPQTSPETPLFLLDNRIGKCADICNLSIYVLRALGLPVSYDFYKISPETANSHSWNIVIDNQTKQGIPFFFNDELWANRNIKKIDERKTCKIYRLTYSKRKDDETLSVLRLPTNCINVSSEYFSTSIKIRNAKWVQKSPIYLGCLIRGQFVPIDIPTYTKDSLIFNNVEDNNIYLLASFKDKKFSCISTPFLFKNNQLKYFEKTGDVSNEKITRKYPLFEWNKGRLLRVVNATIEGSNSIDFATSERLMLIDTPTVAYNKEYFHTKNSYRFVKFKARADVPLELAELHFFSSEKELTPKKIISGASFYDVPEMNIENCFDNDPLTYFLSKANGDAITFDFGEKINVNSVLYVPRNDDNFIRLNDVYELYYFSPEKKEWESLGKQKATTSFLEYNIPKGVLLFLKNHTRGVEEQIFFMKDHKQVFISDLK